MAPVHHHVISGSVGVRLPARQRPSAPCLLQQAEEVYGLLVRTPLSCRGCGRTESPGGPSVQSIGGATQIQASPGHL